MTRRLLLLLPTTTYRTDAFVTAALRLGVELTVASDRPSAFESAEADRLVTLDFADPARAVAQAAAFAARYPVHAVFGVDDDTAVVGARIAEALGLPHSPVPAVEAARDKYRQRVALRDAGVPVPAFATSDIRRPTSEIILRSEVGRRMSLPVVIKPLHLAASRGVMRADSLEALEAARRRLARILAAPDVVARGAPADRYLIEEYVPGPEFALEGLVSGGRLHVLALFDKPDPMEGPVFEETIYVTPSRHPGEALDALRRCAEHAVRALGLTRGPVHAELRYNDRGPWLIELAARPIGGRCGQVLRFAAGAADVAASWSLEQVLLAHAIGALDDPPPLEPGAAGVMMLPVTVAGVVREVRGIAEARAVPGVSDVVVTVHRGQRLVPLPEESRYPGFIFARGDTPAAVEAALREASAKLRFVLEGD